MTIKKNDYKFLFDIDSPADLRKLPESDLKAVCQELRRYIIDLVSENPGHFGASLGVVELTVALHYVYNTPIDKLIWDVGHQAYSHKILTGRRDLFYTNRKHGGISGFPSPEESEYDAFGVGHSSTSISAALGMATSAKLRGEDYKTIAVIGDGSLGGGMAFEAMNCASEISPDMLIVLNDNSVAIDPSVGAMHNYLVKISASDLYNNAKNKVWNALGRVPYVGHRLRKMIQKIGSSTKSLLYRVGNLFDSLNIRYFGPIDGHDVEELVKLLQKIKKIPGPKLLHVITTKGKGYMPAESDQTLFHSPGVFNKETGKQVVTENANSKLSYHKVFGETILELARANNLIVGITPAMLTGSSLNIMKAAMPERVFDVGIAEQHAVTYAAGLAASGMIPFCNIYSSFSQRAFDQVIHDVALQKLRVVICLDRAGFVGGDGATHHGVFDMAFLRCIPNLTIFSPMNEHELRNIMYTVQAENCGPVVIRYPRSKGVFDDWHNAFELIEIGKGRKLKSGKDVAVVSIGPVGNSVQEAVTMAEAEGVSVSHYDLRFLKPFDDALLDEMLSTHSEVITVEEGVIAGGMGSAVLEYATRKGYKPNVTMLGVPDRFIAHGRIEEQIEECGFDTKSILRAIKKAMARFD